MNDLKFAIKMEHDGEKYYTQQAEINKNNSLHTVCLMLAADENNHARILTGKMNENPYQLSDTDTLLKVRNVFEGIGDIKTEVKETASQLDFYRIASDIEKQSIDLYTKYLSKAEGIKEKELFEYLIGQEKQHFTALDELALLLSHAEEWSQSAEFTTRPEY